MKFPEKTFLATLAVLGTVSTAQAAMLCEGFGPQTPRDISDKAGQNTASVAIAPPANELNLCNLHTHTNAEHKGPGFSVFAGDGEHGGYKCGNTGELTDAELKEPASHAYHGVKPGDTIEVHWVYSSCNVQPGKGLGSCLSDSCANPQLRVESQVFLVVNDPKALNFLDFAYDGNIENGRHQAKALPSGTGEPVTFIGSTTGPSYTQATCSPFQVTWSVRPQCAKLDINSLNAWADNGNVFEEDHSHGVRQLVTAKELLAPITD
ncbi:delta-class carbonic anhydrase [Roseibium aggregatum]|uniref:delta-class carbonic anhydrase n=1 Tax=Roseibium aggregatum TaxID=187304 RepID=UPI001AD8BE4E|nr:delta-class carbonic anhydrase [Roseibium aggregatum]